MILGNRGFLSTSAAFVAIILTAHGSAIAAAQPTPVPYIAAVQPAQDVVPGNSASRLEGDDQHAFVAAVAANVTPAPAASASAPPAMQFASAPGPLPIYDASGAVVAYTSASDLAGRKPFVPVLDGNGTIVGYHLVTQPSDSASRLITDPRLKNCQVAAQGYAGVPQSGSPVSNSTQWSRNFRYVAQGADAIVAANAIRHGAVSRGIFGFIRSPIGFILGQAVEDLIVDRTTANACPSVQNMTNLGLGLSAVVNAFRAGTP